MFFQSRFLDLLFHIFFNLFQKWSIWGPPSKSDGIQNGTKIDQVAPKCWKSHMPDAPLFQTLFSRNHSNPRAVGASWLLKGHLFDGDWLIFCFCCVSLCSVLYNISINLFFLTWVNAQPLSPPFFEEIAAHTKKHVFSQLCVCVCVFFYLFIFLLIFGYPLPTPRASLASFWIDLGAIVGLAFPRFPPPALNSCRDFAINFARNLQRTCRELSRNLQEMRRTCGELARSLCKELSPKRNLKRRIPFLARQQISQFQN